LAECKKHKGWFHSNPKNKLSIEKHKGKIHVWGAINNFGNVALHVFTNTNDSSNYTDILINYLTPNANRLNPWG